MSQFCLSQKILFLADFWDGEGKARGLGWHLISPWGWLVSISNMADVEKVTEVLWGSSVQSDWVRTPSCEILVKKEGSGQSGQDETSSDSPAGFSTYWWAPIFQAGNQNRSIKSSKLQTAALVMAVVVWNSSIFEYRLAMILLSSLSDYDPGITRIKF